MNKFTDDFIENLVEDKNNIIAIVESFDKNKKLDKNTRNNITILKAISDKFPHKLYEYWDLFFLTLQSKIEFKVLTSLYVITNILSADKEDKFYNDYDKLFSLLYNNNKKYPLLILDRIQTILNAKPYWENKISNTLIDYATYLLENSNDEKLYLKLITTFDSYFELTSSKFQIINILTSILNKTDNIKLSRKIKSVLRKRKVKIYSTK